MRIAVDAMGADDAQGPIVDGALVAAKHLGLELSLVGPDALLRAELDRHPDRSRLGVRIVNADDVVEMAERPAAALRAKPHASVRVAADLVARGSAAAFFSAGNTGASMLAAHAAFGMLPGVDRPALATTIPTRQGAAVLLDSGANTGCRAQHLVQFAMMGSVYAQLVLDVARPRVGLLSIGEEETKGTSVVRDAHQRLKSVPINFCGNVEARDVFSGDVDVIVCDGFTGNVALKTSEGLVEMVEELLRAELSRTFSERFGYLLSRRAFRRFRRKVDYSESGGAPLLGVAGLCIVGHGRSSSKAVRNAVAMAARFASLGVVQRIEEAMTVGVAGAR